ncbi:MAG TPA: MFS transporter [Rhodobacteraceae bacterium]|jgi:predicted MFS family arabinose efflux permease|nr:MFS transporter [Paracoccaceae bacterium]HBR63860.1 MFS transporter [Paracoccaceae bacterium]
MRLTSPYIMAKRNLIVLVLANALLGAQMPMMFTIAGLAGQSLAVNVCFATLPITMIVLASMLSAYPLSMLMQRYSRRVGFWTGAVAGMLGGLISAYALYVGSFAIFLIGSFFSGTYMSAQGFYRFAATDGTTPEFRPKAISYVMSGGLVAAVLGTELVKVTSDLTVIPFIGSYVAIALLNMCGASLFWFLKSPPVDRSPAMHHTARSRIMILKDPKISAAIACAMVTYGAMNLVMTSTPLAIVGCGYSANNAADVVRFHVLAMYLPSFFTGHLIARFGVEKIIACGLTFLGLASLVALNGTTLPHFFITLILLGVGWNFGFIGATTALVDAHGPHESGRVQGMNDLFVFGGVTVASFASGGLMNCAGGTPQSGWAAVNYAVAPLLLIAAISLFGLIKRRHSQHF